MEIEQTTDNFISNDEIKIHYPGLLDRIKAVFTDYFILLIFLITTTNLISKIDNIDGWIRSFIFISILALYDPVSVSFFGGTIGHHAMGIKVKQRKNNDANINFIYAIIRNVVKAFLGWISLISVSSSSEKLAIHDMAAGSVVLFKVKKQ